jgi:predicted membrane-bound spermidine synthase
MDVVRENTAHSAGPTQKAGSAPRAEWLVLAAFFLSGVSALTYQVAWQRLLYAEFGVDLESITIIVSCFMLGLGIGSLLGGWLADRFPTRHLRVFGFVELSIGLFGIASPWVIMGIGETLSHAGPVMLATSSFAILLVPTLLMGATLPLLIAHFYGRYHSVGVTVGTLYFVNTLGAAAGAYATGLVVFNYLTIGGSIRAAVVINFAVATAALLASRRPQ